MLSGALPTHLITYLNSPSFSDIILHSRATTADSNLPPSPTLPSSSPHLHNSNIAHPLRHSQSLTLPPPSYSPSFSATAASTPSSDPRLSPLFPASLTSPLSTSPSAASFSLDDYRFFYCHRVVLAGRSAFWSRLLTSLGAAAALPSFTASCLSSQPLVSLVAPSSTSSLSSDPGIVELSLLIHPDALFLLLKYVYSGKADLSFMEHRATQHDLDDLNTVPSYTTAAFAFSSSALSLSLSQPDYHAVLIQQLLLYSHLFELHSLYSMLVQHFCTLAPRQLQLHLQSLQSIKADTAFETRSGADASSKAKSSSSPSFLSMSLLHYGQHDVARGVYVRIASSPSSQSSLSSSLVDFDGQCWRRYKIDPLLFASRSGFFYAMFNAEWKENHVASVGSLSPSSSSYKDDVVLQDLSQLEFEHLLQFLYTDEMRIEGGADGRSEGRMGGSPFLKRSMQHLAIDNPHTRALLISSPSFAHLVSLLSFAILYAVPSLTEYLQHLLYQHVTPETVCTIWPLVLNPFFSPSATPDTAASPVTAPSTPPLLAPNADFFTDLDILHEACLQHTCQHFLRISHQPSFLHLPLPLLKHTLDPGTVECDSRGMIEALERWMDARVRREGVVVGGVEEANRKSELRLCLFPPSTLFNRSEKNNVLTGNMAMFRRLGWTPQMRS